jgi:arylsulfatase A-like enzyme
MPPVVTFLRLALVATLAASAVAPAPAATPAGTPPNVILIVADDFAVGDIAAFNGGRTRTPAIDRLAAEGVWFHAAYSASAVCAPARAAIYTGRYPHRTGVVSLDLNREPDLTRLRLDEVTLADAFRAGGYVTGLIGKWHTGKGDAWHPLRRGFVEFEGFSGSEPSMTYFSYPLDVQGRRVEVKDNYLTDDLSARALAFVRRHRDRPFFLNLCHYAPHRPLGAPAEIVARYRAQGVEEKIATIYAMNEVMDRGLGELLAELDRLALTRKTLVIFTSDNGPDPIPGPRFNHGLRGMKYEVTEGGIRVPLIFRWPGRYAPGSRQAVAHFIDFFPTLVELCGLRVPPAARTRDGASLLPVLAGERDRTDALRFWQWNRATPDYSHNAAVRDGPWKLVRPFVTRNVPEGASAAAPALYHLPTDPFETTDVAAQHPERVARLRAALDAWSAEVERERRRP